MELFNSTPKILKKLTQTYYASPEKIIQNKEARIIIFSDHHRGDRSISDYFQRSEKVYNAALAYYLEKDFTLILAGDVEELWECHPKKVVESYPFTYELEKKFYERDCFLKISGNHDNLWRNPSFVKKYLGKIFPRIKILDGIRLVLKNKSDKTVANIFVTHGHQGTFLNDTLDWVGRFWMRNLQKRLLKLFKQKYQTPAANYSLREEHEKTMFEWSDNANAGVENKTLFITGHTHHPIFLPHNTLKRLQKNIWQLAKKKSKRNKKMLAKLRAQFEYYKADIGYDLYLKNSDSYYFNTGCCSFSDGSITGVEIYQGKIKLIKWIDDYNHAKRIVLGSEKINDI